MRKYKESELFVAQEGDSEQEQWMRFWTVRQLERMQLGIHPPVRCVDVLLVWAVGAQGARRPLYSHYQTMGRLPERLSAYSGMANRSRMI